MLPIFVYNVGYNPTTGGLRHGYPAAVCMLDTCVLD
jgi:hypothetical protein